MQIHKMPEEAQSFLSKTDDLSKVMLVSTSGGGDDFVQGFDVDAISAPSRSAKIPLIMEWITTKIDGKLQVENVATLVH